MPVSISTVKSPEASEGGRSQAVAELDFAKVGQDFFIEEVQAIANAELVLHPRQARLKAKSLVTVNSVRQISCPRKRSHTASMASCWKSRLGSKCSFMVSVMGFSVESSGFSRLQ